MTQYDITRDNVETKEYTGESTSTNALSDLSWNQRWKPIFSIVYLIICLFDFVIVPSFIGMTRDSYIDLIPLVKDLSTEAQMMVLSRQYWQPLTLQGSGLIHIAFGAILGVVAWKDRQ